MGPGTPSRYVVHFPDAPPVQHVSMRTGSAPQWGCTCSDVYWPPEVLQLFSISVCAWARGAAEIIAATASVKVAAGSALNGRLFIFLQYHFTHGMSSAVIRVRLLGAGSRVPVPVAGTVVTGFAGVVLDEVEV